MIKMITFKLAHYESLTSKEAADLVRFTTIGWFTKYDNVKSITKTDFILVQELSQKDDLTAEEIDKIKTAASNVKTAFRELVTVSNDVLSHIRPVVKLLADNDYYDQVLIEFLEYVEDSVVSAEAVIQAFPTDDDFKAE